VIVNALNDKKTYCGAGHQMLCVLTVLARFTCDSKRIKRQKGLLWCGSSNAVCVLVHGV
jgi:hypothetical protein